MLLLLFELTILLEYSVAARLKFVSTFAKGNALGSAHFKSILKWTRKMFLKDKQELKVINLLF